MIAGEGEFVARGGYGNHAGAHELGDLDRGKTGAAGSAEYGYRLARLEQGAVLQAVQGRAVGDGEAGRNLVADAVRDGDGVLGLGDDLLAAAIAADIGHHPLPEREVGHPCAESLDHAGNLGSRREGQRRGDLVLVAEQERVEEVEPDGRHFDQDIVRAGLRLRDVFEAQRLRPAKFGKLRNAHRGGSICGVDQTYVGSDARGRWGS